MKYKISIAVDAATLNTVRDLLRTKQFRNRSHLFEYALEQLSKEVEA